MLSSTKRQYDILAGQQHNWCQLLACFISKSIKMTMIWLNKVLNTTSKRPVAYSREAFGKGYFYKNSATVFQFTSKTSVINILS